MERRKADVDVINVSNRGWHVTDDVGPLPPDWRRRVLDAALDHHSRIVRDGPGPGSVSADGLDYRVLPTSRVRRLLPFLWEWYLSYGLAQARSFDSSVECAESEAAINVNLIVGRGGRYEPHTDDRSHTMVLFASDLEPEDGGFLELGEPFSVRFQPKSGQAVIFDSSKIVHAVTPILRDVVRVTVVCQYLVPDSRPRTQGLDQHLYGE